jgi:hypothetical protein
MLSLSFHLVKNKTCNSFMKLERIGTDMIEDIELENTILTKLFVTV